MRTVLLILAFALLLPPPVRADHTCPEVVEMGVIVGKCQLIQQGTKPIPRGTPLPDGTQRYLRVPAYSNECPAVIETLECWTADPQAGGSPLPATPHSSPATAAPTSPSPSPTPVSPTPSTTMGIGL